MVVGDIQELREKHILILTLIKSYKIKSPVAVKAPRELKWFVHRRICNLICTFIFEHMI